MSEEIKWRHWEDSYSECGSAYVGGLKIIVQDCDGDFTRWNVLRGNALVATGEANGIMPYHFDTAKERSVMVAKAIVAADEYRALALNPETGTQNDLGANAQDKVAHRPA